MGYKRFYYIADFFGSYADEDLTVGLGLPEYRGVYSEVTLPDPNIPTGIKQLTAEELAGLKMFANKRFYDLSGRPVNYGEGMTCNGIYILKYTDPATGRQIPELKNEKFIYRCGV